MASMTSSLARRCAAAASAAVLAAGLAGCGGSDDDPADDPSSAASGATGESSEDAGDPSDDAAEPTPSAYLSVDGAELTPPGTELAFGEPGVIAWEAGTAGPAVLDVTVDRVDRTTFKESFQGWVITEEMKKQTPLFVRLTVTNAGSGSLGGEQVPITVVDDSGIRVQPTTATEKEFKPCPGGPLPKKFKAGATADLCLLYLLAPGASFAAVGFLPIDAEGEPVGEAITWNGELTAVGEEIAGQGGKNKGDRDKGGRNKGTKGNRDQ